LPRDREGSREFDHDRAGSGDKSMNPVFAEERYIELLAGLRALEQRGAAPVFCGRNWR
jgi:hypothetical protein